MLAWPKQEERRKRPSPSAGDSRRIRELYRGCLLGGAVGDALGAPVEFIRLPEIRARFGPHGITEFAPAYGKLGAITDDRRPARGAQSMAEDNGPMSRGRRSGLCNTSDAIADSV